LLLETGTGITGSSSTANYCRLEILELKKSFPKMIRYFPWGQDQWV